MSPLLSWPMLTLKKDLVSVKTVNIRLKLKKYFVRTSLACLTSALVLTCRGSPPKIIF